MRKTHLTLTRRRVLQLGGASLLAGAAGCGPRARDELRIAVQPWCGYQFMRLAENQRWLPAEVHLVPLGTAMASIEATRAGEVDGAAITLDQAFQLADQGIDLEIVLIFNVSAGADMVLARPEVGDLTGLRGRRIAVEATTLGTLMLVKMLEAAGLRRDDVQVVEMGEDHARGWASLQPLDAVITYEPWLGDLRASGLVPVFDSRSLPQTILDVLAIRRDAARRVPDLVTTLIEGHFRALALWQRNKIDTAYLLAPLMELPVERVADALKGIDLPDLAFNLHSLRGPSQALLASAEDILTIMREAGLVRSPLDPARMFTADYLPGRVPDR